jgi:hypothetical protein
MQTKQSILSAEMVPNSAKVSLLSWVNLNYDARFSDSDTSSLERVIHALVLAVKVNCSCFPKMHECVRKAHFLSTIRLQELASKDRAKLFQKIRISGIMIV